MGRLKSGRWLSQTLGLTMIALLTACGTAAPAAAPDCIGEGVKFSAREAELQCCSGLTRIEAYRESRDPLLKLEDLPAGCEPAGPPDIKMCTRCGDGACGLGENRCNCPSDCSR